MAATTVTPIDVLVRSPLPIIPHDTEELPLDQPDVANEHHGNHPGPELQKTLAGCALRNSQIQLVHVELHNLGERAFHRKHRGIRAPRSEREHFRRIFFPIVGYVPDWGVDMTQEEPLVRPMTDDEIAHLRMPHPDPEQPFSYRHIRYSYEPIRDFFREYIYGQELARYQSQMYEFLEQDEPEQRLASGSFLLKQAIVQATDPVRELYVELQAAGKLHPLMPPKPDDIIRWKLGMPERDEVLLVDAYQQFLRSQVDQTAAA